MAKLTRSQRAAIASVLYHAKAAHSFIHGERIAVCRRDRINQLVRQSADEFRAPGVTRVDHVGRDDSKWSIDYVDTLTPISKGIGSPLVQLDTAIRGLESMLQEIDA